MTGGTRVANPPADRPLLVFDGDCGFCRFWVDRWAQRAKGRFDVAPYQEAASRFPEVPESAFGEAVHFIETDGRVSRGAEAVFRARAHARGGAWLLRWYERVPGFARLTEAAYRFVASHRGFFSALTRLSTGRPTYRISSFMFLRLLGLVYLLAFVSLWAQVEGLIGRNGILPVERFLSHAQQQLGVDAYTRLPTLCWLNNRDAFLHILCGGGVLFSLLLMAGILPMLCSLALWALYLSLTVAGQLFLGYQWDNLLLEAGLLAILLSPPVWRSRFATDPLPSRVAVFLVQLLLFKLMFSSGYVKLRSNDEAWWNLTALTYHYWTQCIPAWPAWYMDRLPLWFQKLSCGLMFVIELGLPFLIWGPGRTTRYMAFGGLAGLQVLIALTGNYNFFNLLSIVLCLMILDDRCWGRRSRSESGRYNVWHRWLVRAAAIPILVVTAIILLGTVRVRVQWPRWTIAIYEFAAPYRSINGYGLFAVMTKSRPEIIVEGTYDGRTWHAYEFKWKPGRLDRRPGFVAPHQPRLDWQMWFAALGTVEGNQWFVNFIVRLLQGSPEVLALLEHNPFPDRPPLAIRATVYYYRFATPEQRRRDGVWWQREWKGVYCPPLLLETRRAAPEA